MVQRHLISRSLALGRERPKRHALPASLPPPESISGAGGFSHPHLPAHRPSWGRGGHRDSQPEPKEGETEGFFAAQEFPHPEYLKPRLVQGGKPRLKSSDPSDNL